ncbi:MAG: hypothetical protein FWF59_00740 [Turicibacter sp.]|nr:hypothetical protein [Turicibacter sp.]
MKKDSEEKSNWLPDEQLVSDGVSFARGCFFGTLMAIPFWVAVFTLFKLIIKH